MVNGGRVLLICDNEEISRYLRELLIVEGGYSVTFEASGKGALATLKQNINAFDVIVAKFGMFDLSGRDLVKGIKAIDPDSVIIAFLEDTGDRAVRELLDLGVYDYISRPIEAEKLFFLLKKGMELHGLVVANQRFSQGLKERNLALERQNILLAKRIEESTKNLTRLYEDLRSTYMRTIKVLAQAIEARDHYTRSHSENVAKIATSIAEEMGLTAKEIDVLRQACELHDLGKIGIDDSILNKPTTLTAEEWDQIKRHPLTGAQILEPLTFLNEVVELVRQHHEHYDGSGYPEGRKGDDILLGARIIHLADAYEAMRSARAYRKVPLTKEEAIYEIKKNSGKQFDPRVVDAFLRIVEKF